MRIALLLTILAFFAGPVRARIIPGPCDGTADRFSPGRSASLLIQLASRASDARRSGNTRGYIESLLCVSALEIRSGDPIRGLDSLNAAYKLLLDTGDRELLPLIELAYARAFLLSNNLEQSRVHFYRAAGQYLSDRDSVGYAYALLLAGNAAFLHQDSAMAIFCFQQSLDWNRNLHWLNQMAQIGNLRCRIALGDTARLREMVAGLSPFHGTGADSMHYGFLMAEWTACTGDSSMARKWLYSLQERSHFFPELEADVSMNRRNVLASCGLYDLAIAEGERYESYLDSTGRSGYTSGLQRKLDEAMTYYTSQRLNHDKVRYTTASAEVTTLYSYVVLLILLAAATIVTVGLLIVSWYRKRNEAVQLRDAGLSQMAELHRANRHLKEFSRLSGHALRGYMQELKHELTGVRIEAITSEHNRMVFGLVETSLQKLERLLNELDDILRFPDPRTLPLEKIRIDTQLSDLLASMAQSGTLPADIRHKWAPVTVLVPRQYLQSILLNSLMFIRDFYAQNGGDALEVHTSTEGDAASITYTFTAEKAIDPPDVLFKFRSRVYNTTDPYTIYIYIAYMLTRSIGGDIRVGCVKNRNFLTLLLPSEGVTREETHSLEDSDKHFS